METFDHIQAATVDEVVRGLRQYGGAACVCAGGSDLMGCLKDRLWLKYPRAVIDLKRVEGLAGMEEHDGGLRIGAATTLTAVAESPAVRALYPGLAEAARRTASPLLRNMGTLGGNICQQNRCWYYRYPDKLGGRIPCVRKGGDKCYAVPGDSRYHSIFGAVNKCIAVNPGDTAPALIALDATVVTSQRRLPAQDFFSAEHGQQSTVLGPDEIVVAVELPARTASAATDGAARSVSAFRKVAFRQSIDFALVNCAAWVRLEGGVVADARVCLNAVYNNPLRAPAAEEALRGGPLTEESAGQAAEAALAGAKPLLSNYFKVPMAQATVADCLLDCR